MLLVQIAEKCKSTANIEIILHIALKMGFLTGFPPKEFLACRRGEGVNFNLLEFKIDRPSGYNDLASISDC